MPVRVCYAFPWTPRGERLNQIVCLEPVHRLSLVPTGGSMGECIASQAAWSVGEGGVSPCNEGHRVCFTQDPCDGAG